MSVAIVTDTNSGFSPSYGEELGIFVLPMPVIIDGVSYNEFEDITHHELYKALKEHRSVSSSQPSPGSVMAIWEKVFAAGFDEIVYIPMSSGLSSSCNTALSLSAEYDGRVHVVNNHRISVTMEHSIYDAIKLKNQGLNAASIKAALEENAYNSSIYISVNTLEYLKKSGRVTAAAAAISTIVNIKPVLTIQGEKLDSFAKVKGMKHAYKKMISGINNDISTRFADVDKSDLIISCAGTFETEAEEQNFCKTIADSFPGFDIKFTPLSCSIASHVGVGSAGIGMSKLI